MKTFVSALWKLFMLEIASKLQRGKISMAASAEESWWEGQKNYKYYD